MVVFQKLSQQKRCHVRNKCLFQKSFQQHVLTEQQWSFSKKRFQQNVLSHEQILFPQKAFLSYLHICPTSFCIFIFRGIILLFCICLHFWNENLRI
jgi:hypothetical protein